MEFRRTDGGHAKFFLFVRSEAQGGKKKFGQDRMSAVIRSDVARASRVRRPLYKMKRSDILYNSFLYEIIFYIMHNIARVTYFMRNLITN